MSTQAARAIATKLIEYRTKNELSQTGLARFIGISQATISRLETCDAKSFPGLDTLSVIAQQIGVTFEIKIHSDGKIEVK